LALDISNRINERKRNEVDVKNAYMNRHWIFSNETNEGKKNERDVKHAAYISQEII
jgi:hypothetical protein